MPSKGYFYPPDNPLSSGKVEIKYMTARGAVSGVDYYDLTKDQLDSWGARYTELSVGKKEHYDVWIDDKAFWSENFKVNCSIFYS